MSSARSQLAGDWWADNGQLVIWGVWGVGVVAFVALILLAISISQRLRPLQRALVRLQQKQAEATAIAGKLSAVSQALADRKATARPK